LLDEEKILPVGKEITAIGYIRPHKASVEISSCSEIPFFLSDLTKDEMEAELSSRAKTLFWASVVLGTMSVCLLGFATYRYQTVTFLQLLMILLVSIQLVFSSEDNLQLDTSILLSLLVISYIL
jgi:hypothetical protein